MKKIILITLVFLLTIAVGYAIASYSTGTLSLGSSLTLSFTTSNNVYVDYAAGTGGISYSAGSYHAKGSRTFGTSSGDTKIYYKDATGSPIPAAPATNTASADFSGWTAL